MAEAMQELHWHSRLTLFLLIGGPICAISSFITTARIASEWGNLELKIHHYVSGLAGDAEGRISQDRIQPCLERWYSLLMLFLRAFTAIAYSTLVVSGYFISRHSYTLLVSALIINTIHTILPLVFLVRLRNYDLTPDLPSRMRKGFWSDIRNNLRAWPIVLLCFAAIVTQVIALAARNSLALATSCFITCLPGSIRFAHRWIYSGFSWGLDSYLILFIISGCLSLSIWVTFALEHMGILGNLGGLLGYGFVLSLSAVLFHAYLSFYYAQDTGDYERVG